MCPGSGEGGEWWCVNKIYNSVYDQTRPHPLDLDPNNYCNSASNSFEVYGLQVTGYKYMITVYKYMVSK